MSMNTPDLSADPNVLATASVAKSLRQFAHGLVIKSADAYEAAATMLISVKGALKMIETARTQITVPLNESLKAVNAQAKLAAEPFLADEAAIKKAMIVYSNEQDRIREEEQRRANEIARKERERLQAIADEAARKAYEEAAAKRKAAEDAAAAGRQAEADRLNAQAKRAEEKAADKVELYENRAALVTAPIAQQAAPKVGGISIPKVWAFEIADAALIPREYLMVDEVKIRKVVGALKGLTVIAGVRVFEQKRVSAGAA
jgi:hypothetical protein